MSRAKKLLEAVSTLSPHHSEVKIGNSRMLFSYHSPVAMKDQFGAYETDADVAPHVRDAIKQWHNGRPTQKMKQKDLEHHAFLMGRTMESIKEDISPSGYKYVKNPTRQRHVDRTLGELKTDHYYGSQELRILGDPKSGDFYAWDANAVPLIHDEMGKHELGVDSERGMHWYARKRKGEDKWRLQNSYGNTPNKEEDQKYMDDFYDHGENIVNQPGYQKCLDAAKRVWN